MPQPRLGVGVSSSWCHRPNRSIPSGNAARAWTAGRRAKSPARTPCITSPVANEARFAVMEPAFSRTRTRTTAGAVISSATLHRPVARVSAWRSAASKLTPTTADRVAIAARRTARAWPVSVCVRWVRPTAATLAARALVAGTTAARRGKSVAMAFAWIPAVSKLIRTIADRVAMPVRRGNSASQASVCAHRLRPPAAAFAARQVWNAAATAIAAGRASVAATPAVRAGRAARAPVVMEKLSVSTDVAQPTPLD